MQITEAQAARLSKDWNEMAGLPVRIEQIGGTFYGFTSELGALRLFKRYSGNGRVEYSSNLNTWFFALDPKAA